MAPIRYITLDTCVWLGLLKIDLYGDDNVFEEMCYWFENGHLKHITPANVIREWDRHKLEKIEEIVGSIKGLSKNQSIQPFQSDPTITARYETENIREVVRKRMERVEAILKGHSEIAPESTAIIEEAAQRNLDCLAPNHSGDSFRDTINILSLIYYIKSKGYTNAIFSTINYKDFSVDKSRKGELHADLKTMFSDTPLEFVYCHDEDFAVQLLNQYLRPILPNFQDYIKEKRRQKEEAILAAKKATPAVVIENADKDFLDNVKYIDMIVAKAKPTAVEEQILKMITESHESYKKYFLEQLGKK